MKALIAIILLYGFWANLAHAEEDLDVKSCRSSEQVVICAVENLASKPIAAINFRLIAGEVGRSVPWGESSGVEWIAGGIEPGETVDVTLKFPSIPQSAVNRKLSFRLEATAKYVAKGDWDSDEFEYDDAEPISQNAYDAFLIDIKQCLNLGAMSISALRVKVVVGMDLDRNAVPVLSSIHLVDRHGGTPDEAKQAYEVVRRAITRCGSDGFPLPLDKYEQWKTMRLSLVDANLRVVNASN
ncbi:hypothetical protein [Thioclava sp. GXIMD4215]|uniref:hypothetical protein n=1 Tax=Thioclava sp. GXIMD4215 TaxID=3131928 RepID=UPI003251D1B6